jgi:hypothetical protein
VKVASGRRVGAHLRHQPGSDDERDAADALTRHAWDWGEIYPSVGPSEHIDAACEFDDLGTA